MAATNDVLLACTIGDIGWLKRGLARGINPNSRTREEGFNGLHLAARHGMLDCMKYILEHNMNSVNSQATSTRDTALHCVLGGGSGKKTIKLVSLLLENGGEVDRQNKAKQSPLHFAARYGNIKCLRLLLDHGADINTADINSNTPYDLACLYGQHECARLLRSLHWANKKDKDLDTKLKKEHLQRTREREYLTLHGRLRKEAAECAYEEWLEQKDLSRSLSPSACEKRREVRSRASQKAFSCASCVSKRQSASTKTPRLNHSIKVNPQQQPRNVNAVGTPEKLYPYTNFPPKHLRCSSARRSKTKSAVRSGRSSRATVQNTSQSEPIAISQKNAYFTSAPSNSSPSSLDQTLTSVIDNTSAGKDEEEETIPEEYFQEGDDGSDLVLDNLAGQFSSQDDYLEDEDDFLFHDVGHTNNLEALALPNSLTKDKTQGELIQLLHSLGSQESGAKDFNRSHSGYVRRNSVHGGRLRRNLSLSAIPEGRMVTSYSNEELSIAPSQILDDTFIEELIKAFEGREGASAPRIGWEENEKSEDKDIPLVEISAVENQLSRRSTLTLPLSNMQKNTCLSPNTRSDQTLKVVNMEWDPKQSSVQSVITASPLTPPPDSHSRKFLPPRPLSTKHSPVE